MKKILITGGPGTGKTSLVNELKNNGYLCSEEIAVSYTHLTLPTTPYV